MGKITLINSVVGVLRISVRVPPSAPIENKKVSRFSGWPFLFSGDVDGTRTALLRRAISEEEAFREKGRKQKRAGRSERREPRAETFESYKYETGLYGRFFNLMSDGGMRTAFDLRTISEEEAAGCRRKRERPEPEREGHDVRRAQTESPLSQPQVILRASKNPVVEKPASYGILRSPGSLRMTRRYIFP